MLTCVEETLKGEKNTGSKIAQTWGDKETYFTHDESIEKSSATTSIESAERAKRGGSYNRERLARDEGR